MSPTERKYRNIEEAKKYLQNFMDNIFPPLDSEIVNSPEGHNPKEGEQGYDYLLDRELLFSYFKDEPLQVGDKINRNDIFLVVSKRRKEDAHGVSHFFLNTFAQSEHNNDLQVIGVRGERVIRNIGRNGDYFKEENQTHIQHWDVHYFSDKKPIAINQGVMDTYFSNNINNSHNYIYRLKPPTQSQTLNYSKSGFIKGRNPNQL
jgi:hypothetical protein